MKQIRSSVALLMDGRDVDTSVTCNVNFSEEKSTSSTSAGTYGGGRGSRREC